MDTTSSIDTMDTSMSSMTHDTMTSSGHHGGSAYFNTNYKHMVLLFDGWMLCGPPEYAGAMLGTFFLAMAFEGLKHTRALLDVKFQVQNLQKTMAVQIKQQKGRKEETKEEDASHTTEKGLGLHPKNDGIIMYSLPQQLARSLLHGVSVFLSMILMLIFMTFDVGLAIMVCAGAAVGFCIFRRRQHTTKADFASVDTDNCCTGV